MALVRVYCGLASADHPRSDAVGKALTVAVVDDSGRLLDVRAISDDPAGYAHLGVVLAERSSGPAGVAIATDSDDHYLVTLLTAAGRPLAFADDDAVDDFAERFADDESIEEIESSPAERRAIGLARALQAGVLSAVVQSAPREMAALKPVLAAHAAVAVGRQAAAVALREVLRELYPAALRAYPDPAEPVPLVVLDALPEPGLVNDAGSGRGHDSADALAHQLAGTGVADAATIAAAVTALRVAVAETPRRNGTGRALADTVATTVREAVAAVRACDAASTTLITAVAQRTAPGAATLSGYGRTHAAHQPPGDGALRAAHEGTAEHARIRVPLQRRGRAGAAPASAPPAAATSAPPAATSAPPAATSAPRSAPPAPPFDGHRTRAVPPPPPGMTPMASEPVSPAPQPVSPATPFRTTVTITSGTGSDDNGYGPRPPAATSPASPGSRANWPLVGNADDRAAGIDPLGPDPILGDPYASAPSTNGASPAQRSDDRVTPPWRADDLPPEPPMLRLVEPPPLPDPALHDTDGDHEHGSRRFEAPPLRLVDANGPDHGDLNGARANPPRPGAAPVSVPPVAQDEGDEDLLIFTATRSAWFNGRAGDGELAWGAADEGWRAAEQAARPTVAVQTEAGLPKRVPKANLVPGSPVNGQERPLRIVRDPARIAEHTSGYFRGWRRGQQVGGYGRPGHEGQQGWSSRRDSDEPDYEDGYQYRAAGGYRSR